MHQALQANDDGDFDACLALCDAVRARDDATRAEVALLRARVYVRLDHGANALEVLQKSTFTPLHVDRYVAARTLTGAAYVRLGEKQRGNMILSEALRKSNEAAPMVQAELALQLGIAKFRLGAYGDADQLFASVHTDADIVYAQALEYRGWVAQACGRFDVATQYFREGLAALATCRRRDRYVEAKLLYGLTALCPELLLTEEWPMVERRLRRFDWALSGVTRWRFWVNLAASMMCETMGDIAGARRWARHAEGAAVNDGYLIVARCRLAAVFRGLGELTAHADLIEWSRKAYGMLDLRDLAADLQQLPLYLAEEIAHTGTPTDAETLLVQYHETVLPTLKATSGDLDRYVALERSIEAVLLETRGETGKAICLLAWSYDVLSTQGYHRRATSIALHLARLTGEESYLAYAENTLHGVSPHFWMRRELAKVRSKSGPTLTPTETEVLGLLVQGNTYKEIAATRRASVKTVGNHVQALLRKFRVHSRGELTAEAIRRGIVTLK